MLDRNLVGTTCVICAFLSIIFMMGHLFAVGKAMFVGRKVGIYSLTESFLGVQ